MKEAHDQLPCLYFSQTDEGNILVANRLLCMKLGYENAELTGKKADSIFTIATRIFQQTHLLPLLRMQGHAEEIYVTLLSKSGEHLPVLLNATRDDSEAGPVTRYAGIVVRNRQKYEEELLGAKKAAEKALHENQALAMLKQQLEQHIEQLEQQMQLSAKQHGELMQFNQVVTHNLQEPLRKLLLFVNILQDQPATGPARITASKIARVAEQMRSVVSGLQQYVWLAETAPSFVQTDLNEILTKALVQVKAAYPLEEIILEQQQLPVIAGDPEQLQILFFQLLDNAVRFRKPGEQVRLHVNATNLQANRFRNLSNQYKFREVVRIEFSDQGMGFDEAYKEQVFELFKRLHAQSGLGIGLSLCRKIAQNHEGSISIQSKTGEGAVVTLILPVQHMTI